MFPPLHIGRLLAKWLLVLIVYDIVVMYFVYNLDLPHWVGGDEAVAILAIVLGIILVFRNNSAYDRWWEARKLWGQLVNDVRNLALKARAHAAVDQTEMREFARLLAAFPHALRLRLWDEDQFQAIPATARGPAAPVHVPGYIAGLIHQALDRWNRAGQLLDTIWVLDSHARALMDVCGGCERIKMTPIAPSYRALTRYGIYLYAALAPWAVAIDYGWGGLPAISIGTAFLLGIELTATEVEDPFGRDGDDLPLEDYCRSIEKFVHAALTGGAFEMQPE